MSLYDHDVSIITDAAYSRRCEIYPFDEIAPLHEISFGRNVGAIAVYFEMPAVVAGKIISDSGYLFDKMIHTELA